MSTTLNAVTPGVAPSGASSYVLDVIDPPNTGTFHSVGLFGTFGGSGAGFDISGVSGTAYFGTFGGDFPDSSFYTIDLQTGLATRIGAISDSRFRNVIGGIAAPVGAPQPVPEPASLALFTAGLASLGLLGFRKHSAAMSGREPRSDKAAACCAPGAGMGIESDHYMQSTSQPGGRTTEILPPRSPCVGPLD
jgi:hypothetical protein